VNIYICVRAYARMCYATTEMTACVAKNCDALEYLLIKNLCLGDIRLRSYFIPKTSKIAIKRLYFDTRRFVLLSRSPKIDSDSRKLAGTSVLSPWSRFE